MPFPVLFSLAKMYKIKMVATTAARPNKTMRTITPEGMLSTSFTTSTGAGTGSLT